MNLEASCVSKSGYYDNWGDVALCAGRRATERLGPVSSV